MYVCVCVRAFGVYSCYTKSFSFNLRSLEGLRSYVKCRKVGLLLSWEDSSSAWCYVSIVPIHVYYCCTPVGTNIEPLAVIVLLSKHKTQSLTIHAAVLLQCKIHLVRAGGGVGTETAHSHLCILSPSPSLSLSLSCSTSSLSYGWRLLTRTCLEVMVVARRPLGPGTAMKSSLSYWSTS